MGITMAPHKLSIWAEIDDNRVVYYLGEMWDGPYFYFLWHIADTLFIQVEGEFERRDWNKRNSPTDKEEQNEGG